MPTESALDIQGLTIAFEDGQLEAVHDVDLAVAPGEAVGLVGESGSGKSLTLRAVLGLLPRTAVARGRITFLGRSLMDLGEKDMRALRGSHIAMIFQDPSAALNPVLRVGDAIAQVVRSHERFSRPAAARRAVELMERVGIRDARARAGHYPHQFSGGMRQRVLIAMALAARPALLLADEPTTALDVIVQDGILRLLDQLRREEGMSLLFVSHDLGVVASVCERVAVMYAGEIVEEGPTRAVLSEPRMPYTQGLIASVPTPGVTRLRSISGTPPTPEQSVHGCRFAPRCRFAEAACRNAAIPPTSIRADHWARCRRIDAIAGVDGARAARAAAVSRHG